MRVTDLDAYFAVERGMYAFYKFEEGRHVEKYRSLSLALAYDADNLTYYGLGPPDEIMREAQTLRMRFEGERRTKERENLAVVFLPRSYETADLNKLYLSGTAYLRTFLAKLRFI